MIDWFTISVPFEHPRLSAGSVVSIDRNGEKEWEVPQKVSARGSYETRINLKSVGASPTQPGYATELYIDGNLTKYLQGHNIWGTDDPLVLVARAFRELCIELGLPFTIFDLYRVSCGVFKVARVDINYMFQVVRPDGSLAGSADVDAFLDAAGTCGGTKYRKAYPDKGSVYFNKGSRRWSAVWYNKEKEVKKRLTQLARKRVKNADIDRPSTRLRELSKEQIARLIQSAAGLVRCEFKLQSLELKDLDIATGSDLAKHGIYTLYCSMMERIRMTGNVRLTDRQTFELPPRLRGTYELWRSGISVRDVVSPATFYRHKKELLALGINIDEEQRSPGDNVIPLVRFLEARPVSIPADLVADDLVQLRRAV